MRSATTGPPPHRPREVRAVFSMWDMEGLLLTFVLTLRHMIVPSSGFLAATPRCGATPDARRAAQAQEKEGQSKHYHTLLAGGLWPALTHPYKHGSRRDL